MFHAWGFSQLAFAASMACTIVTRRKFDPEATLTLVDTPSARPDCASSQSCSTGSWICPTTCCDRYSGRSLRFAAASGSRMRPDVVTAFMDRFGDVIYNNYNATEAGMIATATPADLRAAPDTAGRPAEGTDIRILDAESPRAADRRGRHHLRAQLHAVRRLHLGRHQGLPRRLHVLGDVGYLDAAGRLFVVGRDDEMIVSGGENVYPIEVEKTLAATPTSPRPPCSASTTNSTASAWRPSSC